MVPFLFKVPGNDANDVTVLSTEVPMQSSSSASSFRKYKKTNKVQCPPIARRNGRKWDVLLWPLLDFALGVLADSTIQSESARVWR